MKLIDADALKYDLGLLFDVIGARAYGFVLDAIDRMPTFDPASIETKSPEILQPDLASIVGTEEEEIILAQAAKVGEAVGELISQFWEVLNDGD